MTAFQYHLYELDRGIRSMVLFTAPIGEAAAIEARITRSGHAFHTVRNGSVANIFFGAEECVAVVRSFGTKQLCQYTDEQDFILGMLLGYDRLQQCRRYLDRREDTRSTGRCAG
jgi:hypothetical protein